MSTITIQFDHPSERDFLLDLLRRLHFNVKILDAAPPPGGSKRTKAQLEFAEGLREALGEVELHLEGKARMTPAEDLVEELRAA